MLGRFVSLVIYVATAVVAVMDCKQESEAAGNGSSVVSSEESIGAAEQISSQNVSGMCWNGKRKRGICPHGKLPVNCKDCRQCEHGRWKQNCPKCTPSSVCKHGKRKYWCKECSSHLVCKHGRWRLACSDCNPKLICQHDMRKTNCKHCSPNKFCPHKKRKDACKICNSKSLCQHGRWKKNCKQCTPHHGTLKTDSFKECSPREGKLKKDVSSPQKKRRRNVPCAHKTRRQQCKQCNPTAFCTHGKRKDLCSKCNPKLLCRHGIRKYGCRECNVRSLCQHGKIKYNCLQCYTKAVCEHGQRKYDCKQCGFTRRNSAKNLHLNDKQKFERRERDQDEGDWLQQKLSMGNANQQVEPSQEIAYDPSLQFCLHGKLFPCVDCHSELDEFFSSFDDIVEPQVCIRISS